MGRKKSYDIGKIKKEPFNIWVAFGLFVLFLVSDSVYALYIILTSSKQPFWAALANLVVLALGFYGYHKFQRQPWYVIPMLLGGTLGTYLSIKLF